MTSNSDELFKRAQQHIPGGVNSPVRAFKGVGGTPVFFDRAEGAYLFDTSGKRYIDYVLSWGPMILGHNAKPITEAVHHQVDKAMSFGAPTALEIEMAEMVCQIMPSIEKVRMVNSGTEATMSAIRLARGYTGRDILVKFEGCYHGHADSLLIKAGSGALTLGVPTSPGVPASVAQHTVTLEYNNADSVRQCFAELGNKIAAVIVEPIAGNMNCVPPVPGFLETLREVCNQSGAILIFDEVMCGFRAALGGAQAHYGVKPDLTTLGKVIGGGMPVGAFGGRADIMDALAPTGPVYQAGTLSGNPVAMAAGLAALKAIQSAGVYEALTEKTTALLSGIIEQSNQHNIPMTSNQVGSMFGLFFTDQSTVTSFADVSRCDIKRFNLFFHGMLEEGIYLAPSSYEAGFMSLAHSNSDIEETIAAAGRVLSSISAS